MLSKEEIGKMKNRISFVIGTRPNYIKAFPVYDTLNSTGLYDIEIIHTGQHYDVNVNEIFFNELGMKRPDIQFVLKSKGECQQLTEIMTKLHESYITTKPDLIIVFGDVTSTLAGALVANKMRIKLAHVESGLRSFDLTMPEENNRIIVDSISDYLFVTEQAGMVNLKKSCCNGKAFFVGNTMIDTLVKFDKLSSYSENNLVNSSKNESLDNFILLTMHRQSNVDDPTILNKIVSVLNNLADRYLFVFPMHHRTKQKVKELGLVFHSNIKLTEPMGYLDFMKHVKMSQLVVTDSGGIQEETSFLGIHCVTLRDNTERPSTLTVNGGSSVLSSIDQLETNIIKYYGLKSTTQIHLWDGKASERIADIINTIF